MDPTHISHIPLQLPQDVAFVTQSEKGIGAIKTIENHINSMGELVFQRIMTEKEQQTGAAPSSLDRSPLKATLREQFSLEMEQVAKSASDEIAKWARIENAEAVQGGRKKEAVSKAADAVAEYMPKIKENIDRRFAGILAKARVHDAVFPDNTPLTPDDEDILKIKIESLSEGEKLWNPFRKKLNTLAQTIFTQSKQDLGLESDIREY